VSLSHPDANITGVVSDSGLEVWEKRFELLGEIVPRYRLLRCQRHEIRGKAHTGMACDRLPAERGCRSV